MDNYLDLKKCSEMMNSFCDSIDDYKPVEKQTRITKKIHITDVAIDKVPYVNYPTLSSENCENIHFLGKLLLKLSKENNFHNEVGITYRLYKEFDEDENDRVAIVYGTEHEVDICAHSKSFHLLYSRDLAVISMHNHTNGTLFSCLDIQTLLSNNAIKIMILLSNKGELCYLCKNEKYDRQRAINEYKKIKDSVTEAFGNSSNEYSFEELSNISKIWLNKCYKWGINFRRVLHDERSKDYEWNTEFKKSFDIKRQF
jgi:hypothetical protein